MGFGDMFQIDGKWGYAEFTLERAENRFDLRQLHVARPQRAGISRGQVGAQQVMYVRPFRFLEFLLCI